MELHLDPVFAIKDTKFKKKRIPWNRGKKGWLSEKHLQTVTTNLRRGNPARWAKHRGEAALNAIPISVYDLEGNYIKCFPSARFAAKELNLNERSIRNCRLGKRKSLHGYMFREAEIIEFRGEKLVSKQSIEPYKK